jgi:uncharacterized protein YbjT (DUF2867 family)
MLVVTSWPTHKGHTMSILVTGGTGTIGTQVLRALSGRGLEVRALTRAADNGKIPAGTTAVRGDLSDPDSVRASLKGVSTLFLLVANVADEMTQAMQALTVAHEAGVKGIVYFSVLKSADFVDVPHFASKRAAERMIEALDLPATILRPAYFMQNDARLREPLTEHQIYGMPIGSKGVSMVDIRDIGEAAAQELSRRERAASPLPREIYALVGPDPLTGERIARLWSEALGSEIRYGGDDLAAMEARLKPAMPAWHALDLRLMIGRYQRDGAVGAPEDLSRFTKLLGHAPRSYADFARESAAQWRA